VPLGHRDCPECGIEGTAIGAEISERAGYIPACLEAIEEVRVSYTCRHCVKGHVVIAEVPCKLIAKGLADA
jgi:hypothetical protein